MIELEDAPATARREANEELGVDLKSLEFVATVWSSPGVSTERQSLFLAPYRPADRSDKGGGAPGDRPVNNRLPGFLRKKVTVRTAATAPKVSPVSPMTPLGTSTATIGASPQAAAAKVFAAGPSSGRLSPAPKIASTTSSAPSSTAGASGSTALRHRSA